MRGLVAPALLGAALVLSGASLAYAADADIVGIVTDATGAMLPGVTITAKNIDTGLIRTTTSDADGRYRIVALPAGRYELAAELSGFQRVLRKGITLTINMRATENIVMKISGVEETVTVTADSPIVETTSSEVGVTFTRTIVDDMPLNGRNPTDLLLLAAPGHQSVLDIPRRSNKLHSAHSSRAHTDILSTRAMSWSPWRGVNSVSGFSPPFSPPFSHC